MDAAGAIAARSNNHTIIAQRSGTGFRDTVVVGGLQNISLLGPCLPGRSSLG